MARPDRIVKTVEDWGIRPYNPEMDIREPDDPARIRDQADAQRTCLDPRCPYCRLAPLAELAEDRDADWGVALPGQPDRATLFASAWASLIKWRESAKPPEGAGDFVGETGDFPADNAIGCMEALGVLIPVRRTQKRPSRRRTRAPVRAVRPGRGR